MIRKTLLLVLVSLTGAIAACGGDDCTRANDQLSMCATTTTSSSSGMMMMMEACAGAPLCRAQCINQFTCAQINGNAPQYTSCLSQCQGK
jgi:hypothetical protein